LKIDTFHESWGVVSTPITDPSSDGVEIRCKKLAISISDFKVYKKKPLGDVVEN